MLNLHSDIEVIGGAPDGEAAVRMSRELKPDVILMDINMPNMNGLEATRIIHSEFPNIRIIGLSMFDSGGNGTKMIEAGATAYCLKDGGAEVYSAQLNSPLSAQLNSPLSAQLNSPRRMIRKLYK